MPIPLIHDDDAKDISTQMRRCAQAIDKIKRMPEGTSYPELARIAKRFGRIADTLEKGEAGRLSAAQMRSIASNLDAIADMLRHRVER